MASAGSAAARDKTSGVRVTNFKVNKRCMTGILLWTGTRTGSPARKTLTHKVSGALHSHFVDRSPSLHRNVTVNVAGRGKAA